MAYKLAEEDKLCGVIYPTYEGFSPIPKATCEMLESKCDELDIEINCGGKKVEKPSESQSASNSVSQSNSTSTSTSASNSTSESKSESTSVSESTSMSERISTTESVTGSVTTSESTSVSESESSSNTGSEVTSDDTIRLDMEKLITSLRLGNLNTYNPTTYDKLSGLQILNNEINLFKNKHNDYVIDYTLTDPEKEPMASTDDSNEYKHHIKLVASKEGKSIEVAGYIPYTITQWDTL